MTADAPPPANPKRTMETGYPMTDDASEHIGHLTRQLAAAQAENAELRAELASAIKAKEYWMRHRPEPRAGPSRYRKDEFRFYL